MNLDEQAKWIIENNNKKFPGWHEIKPERWGHYAISIAGEAGELANIHKKFERWLYGWSGQHLGPIEYCEKIMDEVGDIFVYLVLFSRILNFKLEDAVKVAIEKNKKRFGWLEDG